MARLFFFLLLCGALCAVGFEVRAEDIYVAQSDQGTHDGSSAGNAHSMAWLNTSTNWAAGAGKVSAGDTVQLVSDGGAFTAALTVQGDGTAGNEITIRFADASAKFSAAVWNPAIQVGTHSFIKIDGVDNSIVRVECTANGTGLANATDATGINLNPGADNVTLQYLRLTNIYKTTGHADNTRFGVVVAVNTVNNFSLLYSRLSDGDAGLGFAYDGDRTNATIVGNTILDCNHGMSIGTSATNRLTTVTIASNRIDQLDTWDYPGVGNQRHLDGIITFNNTSAPWITHKDWLIYANTIGPRIGTNNTAGIFMNGFNSNNFWNVRIFNNLFAQTNGQSWSNGHLTASGTNVLVANNTFLNQDTNSGSGLGIAGGNGIAITNNLFLFIGTPISFGSIPLNGTDITRVGSDYNRYVGLPPGSGTFYVDGFRATTFAGWKDFYGLGTLDAHSLTNLPSLDASYVPTAGDTVARNAGVDLSAYFTTDFAGRTRDASFDIGANEYVAAGGPTQPWTVRGGVVFRPGVIIRR
jgi:hypothetical protein